MAKIKNLVMYIHSQADAQSLAEDYQWIGRETVLEEDSSLGYKLTILALPTKSKRKSKLEGKRRAKQDSLDDSYSY